MACGCEYDCVESRLGKVFYRYGKFIGRNPIPFLIVPLFVAAALTAGMAFFKQDTDVEYLFTPENSQAMKDRDRAEELFPLNDVDEFQPLRQNRLGRFGRLIVTAKDDGDVLRENVFSEILKIHDYVLEINATDDGKSYQFDDLCGKWAGTCNQNALLQLYDYNASNVESVSLQYPVHRLPQGIPVFIGNALGGIDFESDQETVKTATAMNLMYSLRYDSADDERRSKAWELEFLDKMSAYGSEEITIAYFTSQTQELELADSSLSVIPLFSITFTVLITFSILCCIMADWVLSKPWLGQLGVLSAGLAVISALGVGSYIGLPFINVVASMPFLILGIGVDDMFIMIAAWRKTSPSLSVEERMGHAYKEAAMSITITSITDLLAFFIGAITYFPSVRIFCIYTGIAVLFDYAYQITFFGACMTLFGKREAANRHCMTCMKVLPKREAPSTRYKIFCAGGSSETTPPREDSDHAMMKFFKNQYGPFLTSIPMKVITLVLFAAYLGVAIWGCTQLQEGIRLKNLANDDSYAVTFYNLEDEYFKVYGPVVAIVIDEEVDYYDTKVQEAIENVTRELEESSYFHDNNNVTQSWLRDFLDFLTLPTVPSYNNSDDFVQLLRDSFLSVRSMPYKIDINFNEDNTSILSSRFYVFSKDTNTGNREREMMVDARRIVEKSDIKMFAYHPAFIFYEQYLAVLPNTLQNIGIAAAAMFVVSLILIPHPVCSIYVTFAIATISTGVVGFMTLWDVRLDSISMINIIICIGFSVDFSAHITYAFVIAPFNKRNDRAIEALHILGWPIIEGALSTILGVAALAGSESYIFRTFFKTMFLVILIGAVHGLLFLPVFLTLIGPCQPTRGSSPEDALTHRFEVKPSHSYENPNTTTEDEIEEIKKAGASSASGMGSTVGVVDETTAVDKGKQSMSVNASSSSVMQDRSDSFKLPGTPSPSDSEKIVLQNEANDETTSRELASFCECAESNAEMQGCRSEGGDHQSDNMDAKTNTVADQVEMVEINKNADSDRHDNASGQIRDRENVESNKSYTDMGNQRDVRKPIEKGESQDSNNLNTSAVSDSQRKLEHTPDVNVMPSGDHAKKQAENATINALTSKYQSESEAENAAVLI